MKKYESMLLGALGSTLGIVLLQVLSETSNIALLVAPFGATFVLVFALPEVRTLKQMSHQMVQLIMQYLKSQTEPEEEQFLKLNLGRQATLIHIFSYFKIYNLY